VKLSLGRKEGPGGRSFRFFFSLSKSIFTGNKFVEQPRLEGTSEDHWIQPSSYVKVPPYVDSVPVVVIELR